jgi:dolichyl-phosphate-mannose-protein mannosyltransferase
MGMEIKKKLLRFYRWEYFWLFLIVLSTLVMHLCLVPGVDTVIFDEAHYVNDARNIIANGSDLRPEHPPLGKLIIVAGEYIFNGFQSPQEDTGTTTQQNVTDYSTIINVRDASVFYVNEVINIDKEMMDVQGIDTALNQITVKRGSYSSTATSHAAQQTIFMFDDTNWGWRFFPILFGTAMIIMFYILCRKLQMSRTAASLATFLLAFENMTFVQNHIAMLDVFYLTFMMAAFLLYICRRYITSGIAVGLAGLSKLNGLLALPTLVMHWFFTRQGRSRWFALTLVFAVIAFLELMIVFEFGITRDFSTIKDPIHRLSEMMSLTGSLTFHNVTHPAASPPWQWLIQYFPMLYYYMPHYSGAISFTIWATVIPTFIYLVWRAIKKSEAALFGLCWFFCSYIIWIPATLITDRVTYPFYFYPSIGAICLGLGMALQQALDYFRNGKITWLRRTLLVIFIIFLVAHLLSFLILSPLIQVDFAQLVGLHLN